MERISVVASGHGPWYCHGCIFPVGFLLTGEAEAICREAQAFQTLYPILQCFLWLMAWVGSVYHPILLPVSPSTEITSVLIPNEIIHVMKVFHPGFWN